jgi:hypothetical protein
LIGHQLPIAVVSMRPERVLTDMCTFWDYGIISEACPSTPRCVLSDSDDFLMIELRSADTARDQLRLGWPEPKDIAGKLKQFITKDPISLARHTLMIHSGDLPRGLDEAKTKLDRFVDAVLAELPAEPTHWANHPIWAYHYPRFHAARDAFFGRSPPLSSGDSNAVAALPEEAVLPVSVVGWGPRAIARRFYNRYFGVAPWFRPIHPRWADVQPVVNALRQCGNAPMLVVASTGLGSGLFRHLAARHMTVAALGLSRQVEVLPSAPPRPPAAPPGRLRIDSENPIRAELLLHGEAAPLAVRIRSLDLAWEACEKAEEVVAARLTLELTPPASPPPAEKYGMCIFELNLEDVRLLPRMVERVTPWMRSGGKIMVFHINTGIATITENLIGMDGLGLDFPCTIHFVGSEMSVWALNRFFSSVSALRTRRPLEMASGLIGLASACLTSLKISRSESIHSRRDPAVFSSLTLQIELPRGEPIKASLPDNQRAIA